MVINTIYEDDQVEIIQRGIKISLFYTNAFLLFVIFTLGSVTSIFIIGTSDTLGIGFYLGFLFGLGGFIFLALNTFIDLRSYFKFKKSKKVVITITIRVSKILQKDAPSIRFQLNSQKITIPINTSNYEPVFKTNLKDYKCLDPYFFSVHIKKPLRLNFNSEKIEFFLYDPKQRIGVPNNLPYSLLIHFKKWNNNVQEI